MLRFASLLVLTPAIASASVDGDNTDAPELDAPIHGSGDIDHHEPFVPSFELTHLRADGTLGVAFGDVYAFAMRGHLGGSLWWRMQELVDGIGWSMPRGGR